MSEYFNTIMYICKRCDEFLYFEGIEISEVEGIKPGIHTEAKEPIAVRKYYCFDCGINNIWAEKEDRDIEG